MVRDLAALFHLAARNVFRNPRRSLLVVLTVAAGAGSLFLFDGFNTGILNQYREGTIHSRFGHGELNTAGYREQVFEKPWEHWIQDPTPIMDKLKTLPGVQHVFPRIGFFALLTKGGISLSGRGQGIDGAEEAKFFTKLRISDGVTLSDQPDGILLGQGLAHSLGAKPGDTVTVLANTIYGSINGADLTVVGIFLTGTKEFDDSGFRIPLSVAQTLLDTKSIESIALGLNTLEDWDPVSKAIAGPGSGLEATPFAVLDKVFYQNAVDWLSSQFQIIKYIIFFIVILGIFSTVSTSVLERKEEVGNLRANGESRLNVLSLFLAEGALLGFAGAFLGLALVLIFNNTVLANGFVMPPSPGLTRSFRVFVELQPSSALETFFLGSACALVGTAIAAVKVVRLSIGEALRAI
ncbi:ABC transporter permease [bacterium]|nr:ABC transporter permease [bacterium]